MILMSFDSNIMVPYTLFYHIKA